MKLKIDPRCRINYASYYIKGLWDLYGTENVTFESLTYEENLYENLSDYNKCFNFVAIDNGQSCNIVIDFDDGDSISTKHYKWCDIYGKVNVKREDLNKYDKIIAIGPSFGIDITGYHSFLLLLQMFFLKQKPVTLLTYFKNFLYMKVRRRKYDEYVNSASADDYIFAISTLWYDPLTYATTNKYRIDFFEICKKVYRNVEGGFFYITDNTVLKQFPKYVEYSEKYNHLLYTKRVSPSDYIRKTKKSALVFNTPSVGGCHGWKLGEFFAMGKAIVSTPLINEMPIGVSVNENIIITNSHAELNDIVHKLFKDPVLRANLEKESFNYFQNKLSPTAVMSSIINKAFANA